MSAYLDHSIARLLYEIEKVHGSGEYAIFGSAALVLRGIIDRDPDDIDVMVTPWLWGALLPRRKWEVKTPNAGDPPILTYAGHHDLNLFFAWRDDAVFIDPETLLSRAELVDGVRLAQVEEILRQKRAAYACLETHPMVAKHAPDIAACESWLAAR